MNWQEISGSWVLIPRQPIAVIHFLGGAFVGTAPKLTYGWLLENLAKEGYAIIATPFELGLDHSAIARSVLNRFEIIRERLQINNVLGQDYLPIYGVGHSLGCKLHLLIGSLFETERAGNVLMSYNNYPIRQAIPLVESLQLTQTLNLEFTPSPTETTELIAENYQIRRNLLIKFNNDELDQTKSLKPVLQAKFSSLIAISTLPGNHLTPLGQDFVWPVGDTFTPLDAIGQWVKQGLSSDLQPLKQEILRWLNPTNYLAVD